MRFSSCALLLLITVILCSIYVAKVSNLIDGGAKIDKQIEADESFGAGKDQLMHFVQVRCPLPNL